jgi:hypothetical protein
VGQTIAIAPYRPKVPTTALMLIVVHVADHARALLSAEPATSALCKPAAPVVVYVSRSVPSAAILRSSLSKWHGALRSRSDGDEGAGSSWFAGLTVIAIMLTVLALFRVLDGRGSSWLMGCGLFVLQALFREFWCWRLSVLKVDFGSSEMHPSTIWKGFEIAAVLHLASSRTMSYLIAACY